ncbi:MAG: S-adenosyl-L-homocysteine hydrolase [Novosphingobium sp.]|nr:S-adenosyl-L-homocysteine hydrolase [Novosphingobium sp.]
MIAKGVAACFAAASLLCTVPARADTYSDAERLHRLDIMLMVTGLRCRTTADDFQADYAQFTTNHLPELNAAAREMKTELSQQYSRVEAEREFDRIGTSMANAYGNGHPWLDCHDLKQVTQDLATAVGREPLQAAADELLERDGGSYAYARR